MGLREEQVDITRRRILDAVRELSTLPGAPAVSVADVARHSGIAPATIYRHFPNRDALIHAAATDHDTHQPPQPWWTIEDLGNHLRSLWTSLADNLPLVREGAVSPAGRELRIARHDGFRGQLSTALAAAGLDMRTAAGQRTLRTILGASSVLFFLDLHDRQGIGPGEAADTAIWIIRTVLTAQGIDPDDLRVMEPEPGRPSRARRKEHP